MRAALGDPDLPWIAGTLGDNLAKSGRHPDASAVNRAIERAASIIPHFFVVDTSDLDDMGDRIHFSKPAVREMGRRYADTWIRLEQQSSPSQRLAVITDSKEAR